MNRNYSLKKNEDIKAVLNYQKKRFSNGIGIFIKPNSKVKAYRVAFSVPKKFGNAVKRNQMKRRLREIVRPLPIKPGHDIFMLIKADAHTLTFSEIETAVLKCFKDLLLLGENNDQS